MSMATCIDCKSKATIQIGGYGKKYSVCDLDPDSRPHPLRFWANTLRWLTFAGFGVLGEGALHQADQSLDFAVDEMGENGRVGE